MASHQSTLPDYCPNCNTARTGNFCANCGQKMEMHHESLWKMIVHFVGHYFHYDNKFWSTLRLLLFRPGALTRAYFEGKRASYINPIQLYIFISAVFFILFVNSLHFYIDQGGKLDTVDFYVGNQRHPSGNFKAQIQMTSLDTVRRSQSELIEIYHEQDSIFNATPFSISADYLVLAVGRNIAQFALEHRIYTNGDITIALMNIFIRSIPKMFFVLLPWFAFLLWIAFSRRGKYLYVDHAVFSLHFHAFTFISVMVGVLLMYVWPNTVITSFFMIIIPFVYLLLSLRNFYLKNWFYTIAVGGLVGAVYAFSILVLAFVNVIIVMLIS